MSQGKGRNTSLYLGLQCHESGQTETFSNSVANCDDSMIVSLSSVGGHAGHVAERGTMRFFITTLALILLFAICSTALQAQSLRERIAARRAKLEAQAKAKAAAKKAAEALNVHPDSDPDMWRINRFGIPTRRMFGFAIAGTGDSRFYAKAPRRAFDASCSEGSTVYFYEFINGKLHLAGRGRVKKTRRSRREVAVEAALRSFRYSVPEVKPVPNQYRLAIVLKLTPGKSPRSSKWYMSPKLKGADVVGWGMNEKELFALGGLWIGMSENAMYAACGAPTEIIKGATESRVIYQRGTKTQRIMVQNGKIVGLDPAKPISFAFDALADHYQPGTGQ